MRVFGLGDERRLVILEDREGVFALVLDEKNPSDVLELENEED